MMWSCVHITRTPFTTMALPSGVYIIQNAYNHNWAILKNDNDDEDVISGTDADENAGYKVINQFLNSYRWNTEPAFPSTVAHQKTFQRNILSS
jgi:hypothetical protein